MQSNWFPGFISGVVATLLGAGAYMLWDYAKWRREKRARDRAVIAALIEEVASNQTIATSNLDFLQQELSVIEQGKQVVRPLTPLASGMWDLLKLDIPKQLASRSDVLTLIRQTSNKVADVNETVRSRESYRIANSAMNNYNARMKIYDEILVAEISSLAGLLAAIGGAVNSTSKKKKTKKSE